MTGAVRRSIPATRPRLAASVRVALRQGGVGSVPFPPEPVPAGDVVLVTSGVDTDDEREPLRVVLAAFDARTGEQRFALAVANGREPVDQVGLPGVAPDGRIAQLVRRGARITLLVADPSTLARSSGRPRVAEVEPAFALPRAEDALLSTPLPAPGEAWVASWGLRANDPRRLRTHRAECLPSEPGPPLWWADDERVLGAVDGMVVTRGVREAMVGQVIGRRIVTGAPAWETDVSAGSRVELLGDVIFVLDRARRARDRQQRHDALLRMRAERIANDPIGARNVDWDEEGRRLFRERGKLMPAPARGVDPRTGAVRFRVEVPGDAVGACVGGPHVACLVVLDEEGVGGVLRYRAADGAELGRRGFHVDEVFHYIAPSVAPSLPRLVGLDHTHLLWLEAGRDLVCEVLADPGREVWRLPLPDPLAGEPSLAVEDGRIFVRDAETLWIFA